MANNPFVPQTGTSTSSGGGRWITNPKQLPITNATDTAIIAKTAAGTSSSSGVAGFYTALALQGASSAITVADTYVTVASLTGSGFMFNCISPTHSGSFTPTIRITVDGVVYTIAPTATFAAQKRLVIGPVTPGQPTTGNAGTYSQSEVILVSSYMDAGFQARTGGIDSRPTIQAGMGITIPDELYIMSYNMSALRFETSLLIEMKASLLSAVAVDKQCAATYRMD